MKGIIYKYVSKTTGKPYIGQTIHPIGRKKHHQKAQDDTHFHRAIQKYGFDDFEYSVVETLTTNSRKELDDLLNERECYWIDYYDAFRNGYNMNPGGGNYTHCLGRIVVNDGVNQRMIQEFELPFYEKNGYVKGSLPCSDERKAYLKELAKQHPERYTHMYGDSNPSKNPIVIEKIRKAIKGTTRTEEEKEKNRQSHLGKKRTPEQVETNRQAQLKRYQDPKAHEVSRQASLKMYKEHPEILDKISKSLSGRVRVNNGIEEKSIKKDDLQYYLSRGFVVGRKPFKRNKK